MAANEIIYEADNRTGINHEGRLANTPVTRLTASSIIGDSIENSSGEDLGKIDNLMVNLTDGKIEYAVVEYGSFLGMGGKLFAIPFHELRVDPTRQLFVLARDKEYIKNSPGFDRTHWPSTNDHTYFNDVNTYWEATTPYV
jgi:sporulation protein YlmC with PRC-barrel domain